MIIHIFSHAELAPSLERSIEVERSPQHRCDLLASCSRSGPLICNQSRIRVCRGSTELYSATVSSGIEAEVYSATMRAQRISENGVTETSQLRRVSY